jgi:hypothetical protein
VRQPAGVARKGRKFIRRHRPAEVEALRLLTAPRLEKYEVLSSLYALARACPPCTRSKGPARVSLPLSRERDASTFCAGKLSRSRPDGLLVSRHRRHVPDLTAHCGRSEQSVTELMSGHRLSSCLPKTKEVPSVAV